MSFIPKAETFPVVAAPARWHRSRLAETDASDHASVRSPDGACSPYGAKRNTGLAVRPLPDFASLHPGHAT